MTETMKSSQLDLLKVNNVTKVFSRGIFSPNAVVAVENITLDIPSDDPRIVTIAGESGSGKSTLGLMVLNFLKPTSGNIVYQGIDLQEMSGKVYSDYRRGVQAVFQNPFEAFNPFYKVDHVFEVAIKKFGLSKTKTESKKMISNALEVVRLDPGKTLGRYSHQLSGGQLQRIMLARAFLLKPKLIVADEPVSMIDASLRAIVLDIMLTLKKEHGISQLYITHDLSTALQISDQVNITYRGNIVEWGNADSVIQNPMHPYTQLLIASIPSPDPTEQWTKTLDLEIVDDTNNLLNNGCKFYHRCPHRMEVCLNSIPPQYPVALDHFAACFLYQQKCS